MVRVDHRAEGQISSEGIGAFGPINEFVTKVRLDGENVGGPVKVCACAKNNAGARWIVGDGDGVLRKRKVGDQLPIPLSREQVTAIGTLQDTVFRPVRKEIG